MQSPTEEKWPNVRIASCTLCQCSGFDFFPNHLCITIKNTSLKDARAAAISYTWGEFDREDVVIGHPRGEPAKTVKVNLGKEWFIDDFTTSLRRLTGSHHAFWLDQLCIPQNSDEIREALEAIPLLYKHLPVIVLFPGSLCKCLSNSFNEYQTYMAGRLNFADIDETMALELNGMDKSLDGSDCLNSNGSCTYTDRIWPAQEIRYASTVNIMWTNTKTAPCYNGHGRQEQALTSLSGYARELYKSMVNSKDSQGRPRTHQDIVQILRSKNTLFLEHLEASLMNKIAVKDSHNEQKDSLAKLVACFLLGRTIHEQQIPVNNEDETTLRFFNNCEDLALTQRRASKLQDYVLSVWVDWPPYKIPNDFRTMSVHQLLAHAFETSHRQGYQYFVPSTFPVGLLGSNRDTIRWAGLDHPPTRPVRDIRDIYRPFSWRSRFELPINGKIGLRILPAKHDSIKQYLTFEQWTADFDTNAIVDKFHDAVDYVSPDTAANDNQGFRFGVFVQPAQRKNGLRPLTSEFVLELICDRLYIDPNICTQHNVIPIFTTRTIKRLTRDQQIPCMGLANKNTLNRVQQNGLRTLTIALIDGEDMPFYEAAPVEEHSDEAEVFPQYAAFAVWLPLRGYDCDEVEAVLTQIGCNAYVY